MIDILLPVLGRPQSAQPVVDSIRAATTLPYSIIFVCSRDDTAQIEACRATKTRVLLIDGGDSEFPRKINHAAIYDFGGTPSDWIFLGADDLDFHPEWDTAALAAHQQSGRRIIGTNDLANPTVKAGRHSTHTLVHRSYMELGTIDEPGKILHDGYFHQYCDNELVETAVSRNEFHFARRSKVEHRHPIWRTAEMDSTYVKGLDDARARADRDHFLSRRHLWA